MLNYHKRNTLVRCLEATFHLNILIRKRNAKKSKPHLLEKNHFDGVLSDMAYEYL